MHSKFLVDDGWLVWSLVNKTPIYESDFAYNLDYQIKGTSHSF